MDSRVSLLCLKPGSDGRFAMNSIFHTRAKSGESRRKNFHPHRRAAVFQPIRSCASSALFCCQAQSPKPEAAFCIPAKALVKFAKHMPKQQHVRELKFIWARG